MAAWARILIGAIPRDKASQLAYQVMTYLANAAIAHPADCAVPTKNLFLDLAGNTNADPSKWMSRIWANIEDTCFREIEPIVIAHARAAGMTAYLRPLKITGSPARYTLTPVAIPAALDQISADGSKPVDLCSGVAYHQDLSLQLSWLGKKALGDMAWSARKRKTLMTWFMGMVLLGVFFALAGIVVAGRSTRPLSLQDLMLAAGVVGVVGVCWRHVRSIILLLDHRIMIAPDWMVHTAEFGATVELRREVTGTRIEVRRYTATCPCGAMVRLDHGGRLFHGRIVGRCEESPQEHVFSFDRITLRGTLLR